MSKFNQSLADRIIRLCKTGLSQRKIAKKVGISYPAITNWLKKGENNPDSKYYYFNSRWNNDKFFSDSQLENINKYFSKDCKSQDKKNFIYYFITQSEYEIIDVFRMLTFVQYRDLKIPLLYKFILEMSSDIKPTFSYKELDEIMKKYKINPNFNDFIYI